MWTYIYVSYLMYAYFFLSVCLSTPYYTFNDARYDLDITAVDSLLLYILEQQNICGIWKDWFGD